MLSHLKQMLVLNAMHRGTLLVAQRLIHFFHTYFISQCD